MRAHAISRPGSSQIICGKFLSKAGSFAAVNPVPDSPAKYTSDIPARFHNATTEKVSAVSPQSQEQGGSAFVNRRGTAASCRSTERTDSETRRFSRLAHPRKKGK